MEINSYYIAIIIGLCLSLLIEIKFGVSPGGVIVPSYLALIFDNPSMIVNIFLVSILTYFFIEHILSKFILVYGKRRFVACILVAMAFKFILALFGSYLPASIFTFSGIGIVSSGIIANTYFKQGIPITAVSTLLTSGVVFGMINLLYLF